MKNNQIRILYAPKGALPYDRLVDALAKQSIREILSSSDLFEVHPELTMDTLLCGVFGQRRNLEDLLEDGDRIEIYEPLLIDPKAARMDRVRKARSTK